MKATITRVGDKITRIRFKITDSYPLAQHASIVNMMPDDQARREWLAKSHNIAIADGWVEVTPR